MTAILRVASCSCAALQLHCSGDPRRVSLCHCLQCQRRTGSVFSIAAFFERAAVTLHRGEPKVFTRDSASGKPVAFHFCADCGSTVFWEARRLPDLIGVAVGAFADPTFPRPHQAVWTGAQHTWLTMPADIPAFRENPPPRSSAGPPFTS